MLRHVLLSRERSSSRVVLKEYLSYFEEETLEVEQVIPTI